MTTFTAIILAQASHAACPTAWSGSQYDATAGVVRWCAPDLNAAGVAHRPGELARCDWTFTWTGSAPVTVSEASPTPGTTYQFSVSSASGLGSVRGQCFNALGVGGTDWSSTPAAFPTGAPGQPRLTP
jgi:hypothetical protein